jgi:hypothetical protein
LLEDDLDPYPIRHEGECCLSCIEDREFGFASEEVCCCEGINEDGSLLPVTDVLTEDITDPIVRL